MLTNFLNFYIRSSFQCGVLCENDLNCYGYKWDDSQYMCTLLEHSGLCIDEASQNPEKVFIGEANICNALCEGKL